MLLHRNREPANAAVDLAVDALASYRVTRLVISDGIVDRPRDAVLRAIDRRGWRKLHELFECPWCMGFWIAGSVVAARRLAPSQWDPLARTLAFSALAGFLASQVRSLDDSHDLTQQIEETVEEIAPVAS